MGRQALLVDTHAHLDAGAFDGEREAVVQRALDAGVDLILAVGSDLRSSLLAVELAQRFPPVYAAVGIHPHEAERFEAEGEEVRALLSAGKVIAVGEIGLDYYRSRASREQQMNAFQQQLDWASELCLPVSVHNRDADGDILAMIQAYDIPVVLHCFSGSQEFADKALASACYLSFAGNVTFPRADTLREVVRSVPDDRLMIETDSPVLAPQPDRGKRNEPGFLPEVARTIASVRGVSLDSLCRSTSANAQRVFKWSAA